MLWLEWIACTEPSRTRDMSVIEPTTSGENSGSMSRRISDQDPSANPGVVCASVLGPHPTCNRRLFKGVFPMRRGASAASCAGWLGQATARAGEHRRPSRSGHYRPPDRIPQSGGTDGRSGLGPPAPRAAGARRPRLPRRPAPGRAARGCPASAPRRFRSSRRRAGTGIERHAIAVASVPRVDDAGNAGPGVLRQCRRGERPPAGRHRPRLDVLGARRRGPMRVRAGRLEVRTAVRPQARQPTADRSTARTDRLDSSSGPERARRRRAMRPGPAARIRR